MSGFEFDPATMSNIEKMNFLIHQIVVMNDRQTLILAQITSFNGQLDSHDR
jgi:hypothetical protein